MYGWLWRHLPGPTWLRAIEVVILLAAIVAALFLYLFPLAEQHIPFLRVTVEDPAAVTHLFGSLRK